MLLTGSFLRSLDDKFRLAVPKRLRDALGYPQSTVVYLAPGTDGSLAMYTETAFARLAEQLDHASPTGTDVRAFSRMFYAQSQRAEIDGQGRVRVPAELAELAALTKDVVLLGVRDHLEIWGRQKWEEYLHEKRARYDEIAENALSQQGLGAVVGESRAAEPATRHDAVRPIQPR